MTRAGGRPPVRRLAAILALALFAPEIRAWRGRAPLARVFWVHGVLTSLLLAALFAAAIETERRLLQQALLLAIAAYSGWVTVAVWRCAAAAAPPWREIARSLTVAWAVNVVMLGLFLQIGLLGAFLGAASGGGAAP